MARKFRFDTFYWVNFSFWGKLEGLQISVSRALLNSCMSLTPRYSRRRLPITLAI